MEVTILVDTVLAAQKILEKKEEYGFHLDEWYFPSVAYADDVACW